MTKIFNSIIIGKNNSRNLHLFILILVFLIIVIKNFPFNSWYTGWDNLHPEFNFLLNIKRVLSAVWQENQGLGTYGGHGYAATLPHTLILFVMSLLIPIQYLRSSFTFLTLIIGAVGVFFLISKLLNDKNESLKNKAALFGGLFYMLNFGTVENFYIQLEAFIIHFAALPWLFLTLINYLHNKSKKNLLIFILISFLASSQGFIPPLFFVYMILLSIFLLAYTIKNRSLSSIKTAIIVFIITIIINAYWFIPVAYYTFTRSSTYLTSYNNLSSTQDFILKNKKYGDLKNVSILKGFIIEALDSSENGETFLIFNNWIKHLDNKFIYGIGLLFFGIILVGAFYFIKNNKKYEHLAIFSGFIITLSLLATNVLPFSLITKGLQIFPIFKQAFRVAFTKFSISVSFFYAICFGIGIYAILNIISRCFKNKLPIILSLIILVGLIFFSYPVFTGNFIYQRIKLNIPKSYFELFNFFNKENKKTRIANFPQGWNWGWSNYTWEYSGSGFLWYGIEQPIMDRAFDVWEKQNENYFWEISYAVYSEKFNLLDNIFEKYQINWIIFDKNIIPYPNIKGFLYSDKLENYLDSSDKYKLVKKIKSQDKNTKEIKIYQFKLNNIAVDYKKIISTDNIKNIWPSYEFSDYDQAFDKYKTYYTDLNKIPDIYFPFRASASNRDNNLTMNQTVNSEGFNISQELPKTVDNFNLITPELDPKYKGININTQKNNNNLLIDITKSSQFYVYDSNNDYYFLNHQAVNCGVSTGSKKSYKQEVTNNQTLRFSSINSENCYSISLDNLPQRLSYLVIIENQHIKGKSLQVGIINHDSKRNDVQVSLSTNNELNQQYIIIPPMKYYGMGYTLIFNNISIGNEESINDLKRIKVYPFPYETIINSALINPNKQAYNDNLVIYYQAYDPGWKAYEVINGSSFKSYFPFIFGRELGNHVLVNNWANGWLFSQSQLNQSKSVKSVIIIFWPQYLEFIGFALLLIGLVIILLSKSNSTPNTNHRV